MDRSRYSGLNTWPLAALGVLIMGCVGGSMEDARNPDLQMASIDEMPLEVQRAPVAVRQGYQFAVANAALLRQVPCYCGCGAMGHTSNAACYLSDAAGDDVTIFDSHALGCSICVDITQDVMRLMRRGEDLAEIRAFVDGTYARYGPSNIQ